MGRNVDHSYTVFSSYYICQKLPLILLHRQNHFFTVFIFCKLLFSFQTTFNYDQIETDFFVLHVSCFTFFYYFCIFRSVDAF